MDKFIILESPEQLRRLARRYEGTRELPRLLMLLAFSEDPSPSIRSVAKLIEAPESTVRRWRSLYTAEGLNALLGKEEKERLGDSTQSLPDTVFPISVHKAIAFLNRLPRTPDSFKWSNDFSELLVEIFDEVDYALVNVRLTLNILHPEQNQLGTLYRQSGFKGEIGMVSSLSRDEENEGPRWMQVVEEGVRNNFAIENYHEPIGFDYYLNEASPIGSIILFRERRKPVVSDGLIQLFEQCHQFFLNVFVQHVAMYHLQNPSKIYYRDALNHISREGIALTPREAEVLQLLVLGHSYEEASEKLYITKSTFISHVRHIYRKMDVTRLNELFARIFTPRIGFSGRADDE